MNVRIPTATAILGYHDLFGETLPQDRLSLIRGICRTQLIAEISGLNYRLKPKDRKFFDKSFDTQDRELTYFCGESKQLFDQYAPLIQKHISGNRYPLMFTRQTCLFALEEIICSDIEHIDGFTMENSWGNLLKYLLCVNSEIAWSGSPKKMEKAESLLSEEGKEVKSSEQVPNLEEISVKLLVLNELNVDTDQFYMSFRAFRFLDFLTSHADIGAMAVAYIQELYGMEFRQYIYEIMSMYHANNDHKKNNVNSSVLGLELDTTHIYYPQEDTVTLFEKLSQRFLNDTPEKLLSIRKYPFYQWENSFMLTDNTILLDKLYGQFINDFWFDVVRDFKDEADKKKFDIKRYRGIIGQFFEAYLDSSIRYATQNAAHFKVKTFDELITQFEGNTYELSDVYIRHNDKVFLGEAKSTGIYDKEKYSGELNEFYRSGREAFFDSFGMKQIFRAVENLRAVADQFDPGMASQGRLKVFPALIINEKAMQTPLMAHLFNKRFQELIQGKVFDRLKVYPLTLMHISDFENMEDRLHQEPMLLWNILRYHQDNNGFVPPFFNTLNRLKISPSYVRAMPVFTDIIQQFQPKALEDNL